MKTSAPRGGRTTALALASAVAVVWLLAARIAAPSDGFDQTQPRTMSYTTDIVANGRWILPIERGEVPATKPPLYNWLAAPAVAALGFSSDVAHRAPSIVALLLAWCVLVALGERLGPPGGGWLAGLMYAASYTIFKLGYLARPDMLLTLLLLLGWIAATALLATEPPPRRRRLLLLCFWGSFAAALLVKGPAAAVLPVYGLVAAPLAGGGWSATRRLAWARGVPLSVLPFAVWLLLVYRQSPDHVVQQLWFEEVYGRVTGLGDEGTGAGPIELLRRLGHMPAYFLLRFAPWSLLALAAVVALWRRRDEPATATAIARRRWLVGAALYAGVTIALFSLSAGKRADYLAGALGPGAILAAWYVRRDGRPLATVAAVVAAMGALAAMTVYDWTQAGSAQPGVGPAIERFVDEVAPHLRAEPLPVGFWVAGTSQVQAQLGYSVVDGPREVRRMLDAGRPIWVVAGRRPQPPRTFEAWLARIAERRGEPAPAAVEVVAGPTLPWTDSWPERLALYRVVPAGSAASAQEFNGSARRFR